MPYSGSFLQTSSKLLCLSQTWLHSKGLSVQTDLCFLEAQLIWLLHCVTIS